MSLISRGRKAASRFYVTWVLWLLLAGLPLLAVVYLLLLAHIAKEAVLHAYTEWNYGAIEIAHTRRELFGAFRRSHWKTQRA